MLDEALFATGALSAVKADLALLPTSHDLPAVVLAPLLKAQRFADASEVLVSLTGLGAPLERMENLTAMLDTLEGLMETGEAAQAVDMVARAELGNMLHSGVMTEVCNTFLRHFEAEADRQGAVGVAKMMQRKGIDGDQETARLVRAAIMGGEGEGAGDGHQSSDSGGGDGSKSGYIFAALFALASAGFVAASEQGPCTLVPRTPFG